MNSNPQNSPFHSKRLVLSLLLCFTAAGIGSFATSSSVSTWYQELNKPFFNPPAWVFGPVWTLLYTMMGISFYQIWSHAKPSRGAINIFLVQLALNASWSCMFFGLQNPLFGLINIMLLLGSIAGTILCFAKVRKSAAILLLPYFFWVLFATVLNFELWRLNP